MPRQRPCDCCGKAYEAKTDRSRFCTTNCRVAYSRGARPPVPLQVVPADQQAAQPEPRSSQLVDVTRRQLEDAGRLDTPLGQAALDAAERMRNAPDSNYAAQLKEFRATLTEALRGANAPTSAVQGHRNEIAERQRRRRGA